jgi:flagellar hook-length control protein FliK
MPPPAMPTTKVPGKDGADTVQAAANGNRDDKPVHVSVPDAASPPQPDAPAPIPQTTPPPVLPQGVTAGEFGVTASAAGAHSDTIATALHIAAADADPTPNFGALAVSIAARSLSGAKQFEIRLDPPELGRVDVRLSIDASGKTQAHMTADQPQTLSLLQKDAPTLTQALRDAGLDVSQSGLNFSLRGQDRQNDDAGAGHGRRTNLTATRAIQAAQSPTAISFNGAAADARVDIHV